MQNTAKKIQAVLVIEGETFKGIKMKHFKTGKDMSFYA